MTPRVLDVSREETFPITPTDDSANHRASCRRRQAARLPCQAPGETRPKHNHPVCALHVKAVPSPGS